MRGARRDGGARRATPERLPIHFAPGWSGLGFVGFAAVFRFILTRVAPKISISSAAPNPL